MSSLRDILKPLSVDKSDLSPIEISGLSINSKTIKPGDLFIAIAGAKKNGNDYIGEAIQLGAVAIVTDEKYLGKTKTGLPSGSYCI